MLSQVTAVAPWLEVKMVSPHVSGNLGWPSLTDLCAVISSAAEPSLQEALRPAANWRLEEIKLLWAKGQQSQAQAQAGMALRMANALAQHLRQSISSAGPQAVNQSMLRTHGRLLSLIGHWLAESR